MVRWVLAVISGVAIPLSLAGQAGGTPAPAQEASPGEPTATFRTNANLVLVDVVVRDKGKPVEGLAESAFRVLEDGRPQNLTVFEEHRATDAVEAAKYPTLPPHVYADFPQYRITSAANVLLLDALNTPLNDQTYARTQMLKYLHTIPPGTQVAVFTLASRLRMVSGFTTDAGLIERALSMEGTPAQKSILTDPQAEAAQKQADDAMDAEIPEMVREAQDFQQDRQIFQAEQRITITLAAFEQLARFLSTVPGRKNLIWVSGGIPIAFDPDLSHLNAGTVLRHGTEVRAVNAELARARVAVYPVDARALMTLPHSNIANVQAPQMAGMRADLMGARGEAVNNDITVPQQWWASHSDMDEVARDTGGTAFYDSNAVGNAVANAIANGSSYYTLCYAPHVEKENGAYRAITVHVDAEDNLKYNLSYRRGYYATDLRETAKEAPILSPVTAAMQRGVPPMSQLIFEVRVLAAGDPELHGLQPTPGPAGTPAEPLKAPVTRYIVDYSIDPHQLALKSLDDGRRQAELEVLQAVYNADGKRVNFSDAGLEVNIKPADVAQDMRNGVRLRQEIDVPAGDVLLRIGVRDVTSGRIGTVEVGVGNKGAGSH